MAVGYDISASAASGSGTGAVQFGNLTGGGSNGLSGTTIVLIVAIVAAVIGAVRFFKK